MAGGGEGGERLLFRRMKLRQTSYTWFFMPFAFRTTQTIAERRNDDNDDGNDGHDDPLPEVVAAGTIGPERRNLDCASKLMLRKLNSWRRMRILGALRPCNRHRVDSTLIRSELIVLRNKQGINYKWKFHIHTVILNSKFLRNFSELLRRSQKKMCVICLTFSHKYKSLSPLNRNCNWIEKKKNSTTFQKLSRVFLNFKNQY